MNRTIRALVTTVMMLGGIGVVEAQAQSLRAMGTQFTVTGVVVVEGAEQVWLREPTLTQNRVIGLRIGQTVGPYRLSKVLDDRIEMDGPDGKLVVRLGGTAVAVSAPPADPAVFVIGTTPPEALAVAARYGERLEAVLGLKPAK